MASYNYTFQSGDGVTPTRLNDARTVSDIVNADISASAAIEGTKVSPNFGSQNVATTGVVTLGNSTQITAAGGITQRLQIHGTGAGSSSWQTSRWDNSANGLVHSIQKSRGATVGSYTAVQSGDAIGSIDFAAADGSQFVLAARIASNVDGSPGTNDMPGRLIFATTADGTNTATERMRITSAGNVGVGTGANNPATRLHVVGGDIRVDRTANDGAIQFAASDTYIYGNTSTNAVTIGTDGTNRLLVGNGGAEIAGDLTMSSSTTATAATAGTNGNVPAQVVGYLVVSINGTSRKIPYYAT